MGASPPPAPPSSAVCSSFLGSWGAAGRKSDPEPTPQTSLSPLEPPPTHPPWGLEGPPRRHHPYPGGVPKYPKDPWAVVPDPPHPSGVDSPFPIPRSAHTAGTPTATPPLNGETPKAPPQIWGRGFLGGGGNGGHLGQLPQQSAVLQAEIVLLALQLPLQHPRLPQQRLHLLPWQHRPPGGPPSCNPPPPN